MMHIDHGFKVGDRVEIHPATEAWMQGDRYGEVESIDCTFTHVRMDKSYRLLSFHPQNLTRVDP